MAHQALHIQWCGGGALLTKPCKYISLNIHGSPNVTYPEVCATWFTKPYKYFLLCVLVFYVPGFHVFHERRSLDMWQVRLTAFPELRFMRRAVHGSSLNAMRVPAQLSEKPSDQRMTRLQPMLETQIKS